MVDTGDLKSPAVTGVRVRVSFMADEKAGFAPAFFHLSFTSRLETEQTAEAERAQGSAGGGVLSRTCRKAKASLVHGIFHPSFLRKYVLPPGGILKKIGLFSKR